MVEETRDTAAVLSDLIPGTKYTISVTAVAGDNATGEPHIFPSVTGNPHFLHVSSPGAKNVNTMLILNLLILSCIVQNLLWSGISASLMSQHRLCFWTGINQWAMQPRTESSGP